MSGLFPSVGTVQDTLDNVGKAHEAKRAPISFTGTGAQQIVAGVTGKKLRVLALVILTDTAGTIAVQDDNASPQVLVGAMPVAANGGMVIPFCEGVYWGETQSGDDLDLNCSTSMTVGGVVVYMEI